MNKFIHAAIYLAIGLLFYLVVYAPTPFDWTNPWVYVVTALWPFALLWEIIIILGWMILIVAVCLICIALWNRL